MHTYAERITCDTERSFTERHGMTPEQALVRRGESVYREIFLAACGRESGPEVTLSGYAANALLAYLEHVNPTDATRRELAKR